MKVRLTRIGNSRGIRIPKPLIKQCGLGDVAELRVSPEGLLITPHRSPRRGWREAFAVTFQSERDPLSDQAFANPFDRKDWKR